jgi:hypothetical protein
MVIPVAIKNTKNTAFNLAMPSSKIANTASNRKVMTIATIANQAENFPNSLGVKILAINIEPMIGIAWASKVPANTDEIFFQYIFNSSLKK